MHPLYNLKTYRCDAMSVTPALRDLLLEHAHYLRTHPSTVTKEVNVNQRSLDIYDLYRYLNNVNYPSELHWVVMLLNNIPTHMHFDLSVNELLFPDPSEVESIIANSGLV